MKDMKHDDEDAPASESMTLRYAAIDAEGKLSDEAQLDERVCECCQTSAAMTSEGPIAVYRDRSQTEVRDIYFVKKQSNSAWSGPTAVHTDNWQINACPVNGPSIAADGRRVAVAWFTGANDAPRVKVAFSSDAGAHCRLFSASASFIPVRPQNMCKHFVTIAEVKLVKLHSPLGRRTYQSAPLTRTLEIQVVHRWWCLADGILVTEYCLADGARTIGVPIDGRELIEVV